MHKAILNYLNSLSPAQFKQEILARTFAKNAIEYSKRKKDVWLNKLLVR